MKLYIKNKRLISEHEHYQVAQVSDNITFEDLKTSQKVQSAIIGGYSLEEDIYIDAKNVKRQTQLDVVSLSCPSNILFSSTKNISESDTKKCLLDKESMYELFGTGKAAGQKLIYNEKEYELAGIITSSEPALVVENDDNEQLVTNIILDCSEELYRDKYISQLSYMMSFKKQYYVGDYASIVNWLETPNKWSDFSFWEKYNKKIKQRVRYMLYENKDVVEVTYYENILERFGSIAAMTVILLMILICTVKFLKIFKGKA